jgi:hypothetical protein
MDVLAFYVVMAFLYSIVFYLLDVKSNGFEEISLPNFQTASDSLAYVFQSGERSLPQFSHAVPIGSESAQTDKIYKAIQTLSRKRINDGVDESETVASIIAKISQLSYGHLKSLLDRAKAASCLELGDAPL